MRKLIFGCILVLLWVRVLAFDGNEVQLAPKEPVEVLLSQLTREFVNEVEGLAYLNSSASSKCLTQLSEIISGVKSESLWALKFLDSWGRLPSGLLWGHLADLGNFEECLSIGDEAASVPDPVQGQYCLAEIPFSLLFPNKSTEISQIKGIKVGTCLPRTCDATSTNEVLNQTLFEIFNVAVDSQIVKSENCIQSRATKFDALDWIAVGLFSFVGILVVSGTIYEIVSVRRGNIPTHLLSAFALTVNLKFLFRTSSGKSTNVISCLNGIRCITMVWIIYGHSFMMLMFIPNINTIDIITWSQTPFSMFLQSGTASVDTFFFISGLLLIWTGLKALHKKGGKLNVPLMYLHRYVRLTPVVAAAMLFYVSLYRHMGDGPFWNSMTKAYRLCHDNWWANLLYVQNYAAAGKMCLGHTWYLAVDMQLFILSPLILLPVFRWKKKALAVLVAFGLLLVACLISIIMVNDFSILKTIGNLGTDSKEMRKIYYSTHTRASPWIIGIVFGYFLYNRKSSQTRLSKKIVTLGWLLSSALLAVVIFALYPKALHRKRTIAAYEGALYIALSRIAWPLALSWIVFACYRGYGGYVNTFLSWKFWEPLGRLSYCMYISHLIIESIHSGRTKVSVHFSNYDVILRFWGDFGITILASIVTYLMFESPIIGIERALSESKKEKSIQTATVSNQNLCDNES